MQEADSQKFKNLVADVHAFYQRDISSFALSVWWGAMKPFDYDAISSAFTRHGMNPDTGQFMPKPADIVKMLQGSTMDSAFCAWSKVDRAMRHIGTYPDVVFDDPLIHRVIQDMGGWTWFNNKKEDEWPFVARDFENRYRGFKLSGQLPEYPPLLIGITTSYNSSNGHKSMPPILIGEIEKAKRVMFGGTNKPMIGFTQALASVTAEILHLADKRDAA